MTTEATVAAGGQTLPSPDVRRFVVIDDHPLFCEALRLALTGELGADEVVCVNSLRDGLDFLRDCSDAEAILLDLNLPDVAGLGGLLQLKAQQPRVPIVVVSALSDDRVIAKALSVGAAGFIPKDSPKDRILDALKQVLEGDVYVPPTYTAPSPDSDAAPVDGESFERLAELTPQQLRILELVGQGKLNKQIAYELSIAETTVKAHVTAILRKLKVHNRTQAVLVAQQARYNEILKS